MGMTFLKTGIAAALALGAIGCGSSSGDDDDSSAAVNNNIKFDNFKVQCWHTADGDYWRFDARVNDADGPEDVAETYLEIRPASGGEVIYSFNLDVTYNGSPCWYTYFTTYQDAIACTKCEDYGYKAYSDDFAGNKAEKTFPGTSCVSTDGLPPDNYADATPSPFCP